MNNISRYDILSEIGRNQYATVSMGHDHEVDRPVAIMALKPEFQQDTARWNTIWQEVLERISVKHEYLCVAYDTQRDVGWIILELMKGDLRKTITDRSLDPPVVRTVLRRALEALAILHDSDFIHGDIKPANLLFDRAGAVKLSFSPGLSLGGQIPYEDRDFKYLAPEIIEPRYGAIGPAVDLYCLGFTALELLKGPEFDSLVPSVSGSPDPSTAWMRWHRSSEDSFQPVGELVPGLPADLEKVINGLLAKNVSERYPSAVSALSDLDQTSEDSLVALPQDMEPSGETDTSRSPVIDPSDIPSAIGRKPSALSASRDGTGGDKANQKQGNTRKPASNDGVKATSAVLTQLKSPYGITFGVILTLLIIFAVVLSLGPKSKFAKVSFKTEPEQSLLTLTKDSKSIERKLPDEGTVSLLPGVYQLKFAKEGFVSRELELKVADDLSFAPLGVVSLEPVSAPDDDSTTAKVPRVVEVQTDPAGASLTIAGKEIEANRQKPVKLKLYPGPHQVTAKLAGFADKTQEMIVKAGTGPQTFKITLVPIDVEITKTDPDGDQDNDMKAGEKPVDRLPTGLVGLGDEFGFHPELKLPLKAYAEKLDSPDGSIRRLEFVLIPAGNFQFGVNDRMIATGEISERSATITTPFYVATTEVTNAQFFAFVESDPNPAQSMAWKNQMDSLEVDAANHPVVNVSFSQAEAFCDWLAEGARLPTEEEWERAARGEDGRLYPWGTEVPDQERLNIGFDSGRKFATTAPVGSFPSGATQAASEGLEVFDLIGNAAEWCSDWYRAGHDDSEFVPGVGINHTIRGASFLEPPSESVRSTWRANVREEGSKDVGIRVVIPVGDSR